MVFVSEDRNLYVRYEQIFPVECNKNAYKIVLQVYMYCVI